MCDRKHTDNGQKSVQGGYALGRKIQPGAEYREPGADVSGVSRGGLCACDFEQRPEGRKQASPVLSGEGVPVRWGGMCKGPEADPHLSIFPVNLV